MLLGWVTGLLPAVVAAVVVVVECRHRLRFNLPPQPLSPPPRPPRSQNFVFASPPYPVHHGQRKNPRTEPTAQPLLSVSDIVLVPV